MNGRKKSISAFSLVEVVLALGVVVFCLFSVFGLLALGVTSTQSSTAQTVGANVLTQIAADLQATPNPSPKGTIATNSLIYGIPIPVTASGATVTTATTNLYIADDGVATNASNSRYRLNVWTMSATTNRQETVVRLLLTWPAGATTTNAQGSVESIIAINRTQ